MAASKQEDNNRRLLEELNRTRQLMMKNSGTSNRPLAPDPVAPRCDSRTIQLVNSLEAQTPITFILSNSQYNNAILPIFPRIAPS
ncbi:unnamed protein product [Thelazia callipaeda]|uniref:Uncharacterized protein n=1 Tax=Thelazia callipaeda TaxID=103827 RepID=A0A0N5CJW3_THECL|nr:unnamed protein product [Thelazia callipaeda]